MMSRVSTFGAHQRALDGMQSAQARLSRVQEQVSLGTRLTRAADDPAAAATAVSLDRLAAAHARYEDNSRILEQRLRQQESALAGAGDVFARLRELAVQANNAVLDASGRAALLPELRTLREQLLSIANTRDAQGRYLFGGSLDASPPFAEQAAGVVYTGDGTQRRIDVSPELAIADTDPGLDIFMRAPTGDGAVAARALDGNAGAGVIVAAGFIDRAQWDGDSYRVIFRAGPPSGWQVWNSSNTLIANGSWNNGATIAFRGYQITLQGTPVHGDTFTVAPAPRQDVFELVDGLVAAIQTADTPAVARADRTNGLYAAIEDLGRAADHFVDARAATGARLAMLETVAEERAALSVGVQETLSGLRDLDYAEALTRLERESTALEALQRSYTRIQSLSLFDFLR